MQHFAYILLLFFLKFCFIYFLRYEMDLSSQRHLELIYFVNRRAGWEKNNRSCRRLDRFRSRCLPNNLSGVESDQPRQRTRLTVPGCTVEEIRGLTEGSYSTSCLTDGGRLLCGQTKTESRGLWGKSACLRAFFLLFFWLFDCDVESGSGGQLTLEPRQADLSLTSCEGRS